MINEQVIKEIIRKQPEGVDLAAWITAELTRIREIEAHIERIRRQDEEDRLRLEQRKHQRAVERKAIQDGCPHYQMSFHGDPAGGSDSFHKCDHCLKEW